MNCRTTISQGFFGRLSGLALPADKRKVELLDMAQHINSLYEEEERVDPAELPEHVDTYLLFLAKELSALVEALVLSDKLCIFVGPNEPHPLSHLSGLHKNYRAIEGHKGWQSFRVYPEAANALFQLVTDNVPTVKIWNPAHKACDTWDVLFHMWNSGRAQAFMIHDGEINYDYFKHVDLAEEFELEMEAGYKQRQNPTLLLNGLAKFRGESFQLFANSIADQCNELSHLFFRHPTLDFASSRERLELSKSAFTHSLFDELEAGIQNECILHSNWYNRDYLNSIAESNKVKALDLMALATTAFNENLKTVLEKHGAANINLILPQIFRYCLNGQETVTQVIEAALRLREQPWAKKLRKYLAELLSDNDAIRFSKALTRIHALMENKVSQAAPVSVGNISLSLSGSLGFSLGGILESVQMRRNPMIVFNAMVFRQLGNTESVKDLALLAGVPREKVTKHFARIQ